MAASSLYELNENEQTNKEVDLFGIPHSRMKQLVKETSNKVFSTDYSDDFAVEGLLNSLDQTFHEFKHHEEIENQHIMAQLKTRVSKDGLQELLLNIHHDTHVKDILLLVKKAVQNEFGDTFRRTRLFKLELQKAIREFIDDFLPHMEEEEEIFQPLLSTYFTRNELQSLQKKIIYLHTLTPKKERVDGRVREDSSKEATYASIGSNILELPNEILLQIFALLTPKELCRSAQVCIKWSKIASDGILWRHLHPVRWIFQNDWRTGLENYESCTCNDGPCDGKNQLDGSFSGQDSTTSGEDSEEEIDQKRLEVESDQENNVRRLLSMARYLIPVVGAHVRVLVLCCCPGLTNGLVYKILSHCKNLHVLDVSQTNISDLGLNGLFRKNGGKQLKHVDLSGCGKITDKTLKKLSSALGKAINSKTSGLNYSDAEQSGQSNGGDQLSHGGSQELEYLSLSGCYQITDEGLRVLAKHGSLRHLTYLDLSGCLQLSAEGLQELVTACPSLHHESLFYCDNIAEGPYPDTASGCQNLECTRRVCCRSGL